MLYKTEEVTRPGKRWHLRPLGGHCDRRSVGCKERRSSLSQGEGGKRVTDNSFFDETREQSAIKAQIVADYFWVWANIVGRTVKGRGDTVAYIDLFAGPGRYKDGSASTPLLVLQKAIDDAELAQMLVSVFNDRDVGSAQSLEGAIKQLPGIDRLKHRPLVFNLEVGEEIAKIFAATKMMPALFFVDPWGYKGLSLSLINALVKDWACECIFFFNYNRVNMALSNPYVAEHMDALFGKDAADALHARLEPLSPQDREWTIVDELCKALNPGGDRYVLPFRFRTAQGARTTHHLIFVSKHFLGYDIMKHVMAKRSSTAQQGVASFEYNPADRRFPVLFDLASPLDELEGMLVRDFASKKVTFKQLYETHSVGKRYIDSNYKQVLKAMEGKGLIAAEKPSGQKRRKGTFANDVVITFPRKGR
jgi:three-Cys-motif partner protein